MSVSIRQVKGSGGLREFVRVPFQLYRDDPFWVPPLIGNELRTLDPRRNPGFADWQGRYWVAQDGDGRLRGRVAGFLPTGEGALGAGVAPHARFGFLHFEDDPGVFRALLGAVERWAGEHGLRRLEGPLGITTFDPSGVLVEGFDKLPTGASSYNFPYYQSHFEREGFAKVVDYLEFEINELGAINQRAEKVALYTLKKKGLRLLDFRSRREVRRHARETFAVINEAYQGLHGFVPLSDAQVSFYTEMYFSFLDPDFVKVIVDRDGRIAAVGISMPSISRGLQAARGRLFPFGFFKLLSAIRKTDTLDLYLVAVRPPYRNAGLPAILLHESHKALHRRGLRRAETNGELETNKKVQDMFNGYGARPHKRRRIYSKLLA